MNLRIVVLTIFTLSASLMFTSSAQAQMVILYGIQHAGSNGLSTLYIINSTTGTGTPVGAVGFERCGAMDFDVAGTLFAACERADGSNTPVLITVNLTTGAGTEIGPTGITGVISDLSFRNADGILFAFDATNDPQHTLFTLNTLTGTATLVGDTGLSFDGGNGIAFDPGDTLWHSARNGPDLNTLNQSTGMATFATILTMPLGLPNASRLAAKDSHPVTGVMWAALKEQSGISSPSDLVTVDTNTGIVTLVAPTIEDLDAIAWLLVPPPPADSPRAIPTLTPVGLIILIGLLVGVLWKNP